jgi:hypothetical protein
MGLVQAFRYLQSLRVITDVLLSSMGSFLAIAGLMTLFIFCFGVIGLQVRAAMLQSWAAAICYATSILLTDRRYCDAAELWLHGVRT